MNETTTDATAILAPLWKRKWLILAIGVLVAALTYIYYRHQPAVYRASTQLYIGGAEEQGALGATAGRSLGERTLSDQAVIIQSSAVGEAVRKRLKREHAHAAASGKVSAKSSASNDFVTITAEARTGKAAAQLANAYAQGYIARERADNTRTVNAAITRTRRQLHRIEASQSRAPSGKGKSTTVSSAALLQAANLTSKINQLESQLSVVGVQQVGPAKAEEAILASPQPRRNAIFGFLLGVLLAGFAAYALSRFDRRLRSLAEIEAALGAHVLTALPRVRTPVVAGGQQAPAPALLEPLRRLYMALALGDMLERDRARPPRVILFLSAEPGDGKSTLIADLALVQREAGERVAVVEADLRRPVLAGLLGVNGSHGFAEVLAGALPVGAALQRVGTSTGADGSGAAAVSGVGTAHASRGGLGTVQAGAGGFGAVRPAGVGGLATAEPPTGVTATAGTPGAGSLVLLAGGHGVANPPALLAGPGMAELLRGLADDHDHVLVDAPPPLGVSDVMPLLPIVDGIVLVARVGHTRAASAERLLALLARASSAPVLGVVANCASRADMRTYGFAAGYPGRRGLLSLLGG
jgi:Mrp family chromosome partitioning ATPase/capsular polysaccharide biosynthesis protein